MISKALRSILFSSTSKSLNGKNIHMASTEKARVALILAGCGVYDGSEIHESSSCLVHLSRQSAQVTMFAPDVPQMHVINHLKGEPDEEDTRNVLVESARIARGEIKPLSSLQASDHDAVVIPGGFGAAKNLCTWAVDNVDCKVNKDVENALKTFHGASKPIGLTCIAPVLAAKCIPGVELTVGHTSEEGGKWPYAGTASAMEQCGAKHVVKEVTYEAHVDRKNKIVTTPAYMCNAPLHDIHDGIGMMVNELMKMTK